MLGVVIDLGSFAQAPQLFRNTYQIQNNEYAMELLKRGKIEEFNKLRERCPAYIPNFDEVYDMKGWDLRKANIDGATISIKTDMTGSRIDSENLRKQHNGKLVDFWEKQNPNTKNISESSENEKDAKSKSRFGTFG